MNINLSYGFWSAGLMPVYLVTDHTGTDILIHKAPTPPPPPPPAKSTRQEIIRHAYSVRWVVGFYSFQLAKMPECVTFEPDADWLYVTELILNYLPSYHVRHIIQIAKDLKQLLNNTAQ
jgi:hypothetical protein